MNMKLEKFDLEKAKAGRKVVTRSGLPVEILKWDARGDDPIIGLMFCEGQDEPKSWKIDGRFYLTQDSHDWDLMLAPEERYVNLYIGKIGEVLHHDLKKAKELGSLNPDYEGTYKLVRMDNLLS